MATLPSANLTIDESSGPIAASTGYIVVLACVLASADFVPRVMGSTKNLLAQYQYCAGIDYCALHFSKTRKPVIFVGMPIATPGAVKFQDNSQVTGTSTASVAVGTGGCMEEIGAGSWMVVNGGVVGTDQITIDLSLDGGNSTQRVRVGNATSYAIPNVNLTLSFGPGTLNPGDVFNFGATAPMWGSTAMASARAALAAQQNLARSWMVIGDLPSSTFAGYVVTEANNYETANQRFVYARAQVADRLPLATKSKQKVAMVGGPSISFDGTAHTITRATGSWITDGFVTGQVVKVGGSVSNNGVKGAVTVTSATVLTFASGLTTEGPDATGVTVEASDPLTFDSTGHTITRTAGSWLTEGFAIGQTVTAAGTTSNNGPLGAITNLSATVMTFATGLVNEGPIEDSAVTLTQTETMGAWVSAQTAAFATIDADRRVDLGLGRATVQSPITGWIFRRPCQWAVSVREYQHDVQIPTYRKADGPLGSGPTDFSITDANGNKAEFDERIDGGGLAGRFTCLRSWGNGPLGAFVALSLTRDSEGLLLSRTHNMAVADVACTVTQVETENAVGQVLVLNSDGTGTDDSLRLIEGRVNDALQANLLQQSFPDAPEEGPRASSATWTASRTDVLNVPGATLHGVLDLELNGTLEQINTTVRVQLGA